MTLSDKAAGRIVIDYETYEQRESSAKNMFHLRETIFMAKEMGKGVGRSSLLQRSMPHE